MGASEIGADINESTLEEVILMGSLMNTMDWMYGNGLGNNVFSNHSSLFKSSDVNGFLTIM